jgi:hypothetical protein
MSDFFLKDDAHAYRILQAQKLLDLFAEAHGRGAISPDELNAWLSSPEGEAACAYDKTPGGKISPDWD